jgi:hypothetical protein
LRFNFRLRFNCLAAYAIAYCLASSACSAYAQEQTGASSEKSDAPEMKIIGVVFSGEGKAGDFAWMRNQSGYERAFFVFNDNEQQFIAHQKDPKSPEGCSPGGGNASARPWQCEIPPRASGIPTGTNADGGYRLLTPHVKAIIDQAVETIETAMRQYGFDTLIYSSCIRGSSPNCTMEDDLGTGIFQPSPDVRRYIVLQLRKGSLTGR